MTTTERANLDPAADVFDGVLRLRRRRDPEARARVSVNEVRWVLGAAGLAAIGIVYAYSPMAAAVMCALALSAFAFAWPVAAMALILALSPIQNDLGSGNSPVKFAPAELAMFLALPAALLRVSLRPRIGPTFFPTLIYLAVCLVASQNSFRPDMVISMFQMVLYMIIAVIVFSNLVDRPAKVARVFDLYILSAMAIGIIGLATDFQFLGTNKNGWGASLSTALVVVTDQWFRAKSKSRKLAMAIALIVIGSSLMMTVSRGGWIAALVGIFIVCIMRGQFTALFKISALLGMVACVAWYFIPPELQAYATGFEAGRDNIRLRYESINYALAQWHQDPLIGVGVGLRKEYDATNIVLLTLAETGWAGLIAFVAVHLSVVYMAVRLVRSVTRDGVLFSFATLAVALLGARFAHGLVDHYWSRGPITCAWAAVGLATLSYQALRREEARRRSGIVTTVGAGGLMPMADDDEFNSPYDGDGSNRRRRSTRNRLSQQARKRLKPRRSPSRRAQAIRSRAERSADAARLRQLERKIAAEKTLDAQIAKVAAALSASMEAETANSQATPPNANLNTLVGHLRDWTSIGLSAPIYGFAQLTAGSVIVTQAATQVAVETCQLLTIRRRHKTGTGLKVAL